MSSKPSRKSPWNVSSAGRRPSGTVTEHADDMPVADIYQILLALQR